MNHAIDLEKGAQIWMNFYLQNLRGEIAKVAKFLGKQLSEDQLNKLTEHLRFDNFKNNEAVNNEAAKEMGLFNKEGSFIRKGRLNQVFFLLIWRIIV